MKTDLRNDTKTLEELEKISQKPVSFEEGTAAAANIGAKRYMECSAKLDEGVQELFQQAIRWSVRYGEVVDKKKNKWSKCICF